ncbi:uncharacterized protein AKAME5_001971800, partial [Lates japonicus]
MKVLGSIFTVSELEKRLEKERKRFEEERKRLEEERKRLEEERKRKRKEQGRGREGSGGGKVGEEGEGSGLKVRNKGSVASRWQQPRTGPGCGVRGCEQPRTGPLAGLPRWQQPRDRCRGGSLASSSSSTGRVVAAPRQQQQLGPVARGGSNAWAAIRSSCCFRPAFAVSDGDVESGQQRLIEETDSDNSRLLRETLRIVEEVNQNEKNLMEGFTDVGWRRRNSFEFLPPHMS